MLRELVDRFGAEDGNPWIDLVFFDAAGGVFASSLGYLHLWPVSPSDLPKEIFVDERYKATFAASSDEVVVSVRHALRPSASTPRRQLRFQPSQYVQAISELVRE